MQDHGPSYLFIAAAASQLIATPITIGLPSSPDAAGRRRHCLSNPGTKLQEDPPRPPVLTTSLLFHL